MYQRYHREKEELDFLYTKKLQEQEVLLHNKDVLNGVGL